ncbi:glycosyltransferase, partial [Halomonas sp.]|uniref:glycosyltransferase n=1 Tax=Halomonas sp. TaxID=1486246 RepID=UPI0035625AA3
MERVAVNLADAFAAAGHDSHLLTFRRGRRTLRPEHASVKVHCFQLNWANRLTLVGFVIELFTRWFINPLVKRSLFLGTGLTGGWLFRAWLWRFERRHGRVDRIIFRGVGTFELVWTFRADRARHVLENIFQAPSDHWRERLFARCLYHDRHLVAVSEGVRESIDAACRQWRVVPASIEVIVNPCPVESIRRQMREAEPDLPQGPYLVCVARLVPAKDQALLLRAYARSGVNLPLVLVGDGQERGRLASLASELGIAASVIFAGQRANPYPWMHQARLFVLSSRFEGMGIVLFEALACGTPVLSVDCPGGIREILKGELEASIVAHDEASLAEGIRQAVEGPKPVIKEEWLADFLPQRVAQRFLAPSGSA